MPDEELPEIDSGPSAPELPATEQSASAPTSSAQAARENGGEQGKSSPTAATETDSAARMSSSAEQHSDESRPAAADDLISNAYERGKTAKASGHQRRAIPPEYREGNRTREAVAWQAGFDGAAMPTFSTAE
jgi:hypothetical protein